MKSPSLFFAFALLAAPAAAETVRISVTNNSPVGGASLTPLYTALHDGSVDLFDVGSVASPGIENVAETGAVSMAPNTVAAERAAIQANSQGIAPLTVGAPPTIDPGETASTEVTVGDPALNRFFIFFSMVVASNDTFIGTDDAQAFELFDAFGDFNGPLTIDITASSIFDAGTEANDFANGPAFVVGQDVALGGPGEGTVQLSTGLGTIPDGTTTPAGVIDNDLANLFATDPNFVLATISIEQVSGTDVPLPASAVLLLSGIAGLAAMRRRRSWAAD